MRFEIDQSGRIEETNRDTIIAIANKDLSFAIRIKANIKRQIELKYRKIKKPKMFAVYGFTAGVIILIKKSKIKQGTVIIDIEYPGYEKMIITILRKYLTDRFEFRFLSIGRKSLAHNRAYLTFKKKILQNYTLNKNELESQMRKFLRP